MDLTRRLELQSLLTERGADGPSIRAVFEAIDEAVAGRSTIDAANRTLNARLASRGRTPLVSLAGANIDGDVTMGDVAVDLVKVLVDQRVFVTLLTFDGDLYQHADTTRLDPGATPRYALPAAQNLIGRDAEFEALIDVFDRVTADGVGRFSFITGPYGHGRRALAAAAVCYARDQGAAVLYAPFGTAEQTGRTLASRVLGAVGVDVDAVDRRWRTATRIAGPAWAGLMAQADRLHGTPFTVDGLRVPDDPDALKAALRSLARHRSLVLWLEELSEAPPSWQRILTDLAPQLATDLPIWVCATAAVTRLPTNPIAAQSFPAAANLIADLLERGVADQTLLGPVHIADIRANCGPADEPLIKRLWQLSAGVPSIAEDLWQHWRDARLVVGDDEDGWHTARRDAASTEWVTGAEHDQALAMLRGCIPTNLATDITEEQVRDILHAAAIEGVTFTAAAVARALNWELNDLVDLFNKHLAQHGDPAAVLAEEPSVDLGEGAYPQHLARYRFRFPYQWHVWQRYIEPARAARLAEAMANAIEIAYQGRTDSVAGVLERLFDALDKPERADAYRQVRRLQDELAALEWDKRLDALFDAGGYATVGMVLGWIAQGWTLGRSTQYAEATRLANRAVNQAQEWGAELLEAHALVLLASIQRLAGSPTSARLAAERSLEIRERILGALHPDTATSVAVLGSTLHAMCDFEGAKFQKVRATTIFEQVLGVWHSETAICLDNLGNTLNELGELQEARVVQERALAIFERAFGDSHPDTATCLSNLGCTLHALGDLEAAKERQERALEVHISVFDDSHLQIATSLDNLGTTLRALGDLEGARTLQHRAVGIFQKMLGTLHHETATSLMNLGQTLYALGDLDGARQNLEHALKVRTQLLGKSHPDSLRVARFRGRPKSCVTGR